MCIRDQQRSDYEGQRNAQHQAWQPNVCSREVSQVHGQAQHHERDDLTQARQRGMETLDLPLESNTHANARSGYRPSLGSEMRRMNHTRARPPKSPKAAPTPIWSRNSPTTCTAAPPLSDPAASRLTSRAMPTGSLAPDSPSRIVEERPAISRCPRMENTTAGSVGAMAVPSRRAMYQLNPNPKYATAATAAVVRKVPATPTMTMGAAAARNRRHPMCMPPSNRMHISATVTMRSTAAC